ncbi:HAD family hydrolase [Mangrovimonas cancribranchiae]|uniref:HAD family hydrolase n=1 Tax=Mangrovimonas cancribranchiae TaxID=3080055 RepID=A0AAU6P0K3_9FLAO
MKKASTYVICLAITILLISCKNDTKKTAIKVATKNHLPSFNNVQSRDNIIAFVEKITDSTSDEYVAPKDRIACFDNDGTLWVEQPLPSQLFFAFDKIKAMAKNHPEWKTEMPFKAVIEDDLEAMKTFHSTDIIKLVGTAHASQNIETLTQEFQDWVQTAQHPVLKKPYTALVYQPMLELLDYLRAHQFKIYIVSGGSQEFMRAWAPNVYGIPEENIIGTTFKTKVVGEGDSLSVAQTPEFEFYDDHEGKIISINKYIGKKPIMVVGNSDGDLEMMEYSTTNNPLPHFMLYIKHTDRQREFDYAKGVAAGALIKGDSIAKAKGWTIIDMKQDWNVVFPHQNN